MKREAANEKAKEHAQTTQQLYDEIYESLNTKFTEELKNKLKEKSVKFKISYEEKMTLMQDEFNKETLRQKLEISKIQRQNKAAARKGSASPRPPGKVGNQTITSDGVTSSRSTACEKCSRTTRADSLQKNLDIMKPKPGSDGNCKRCEALLMMNGLQVQKIKELKKKLGKK